MSAIIGPHFEKSDHLPERAASRLRVQCRRGTMGLGPNLADRLLDLTNSQARVSIHADVHLGEELELILEPVGSGHPVRVVGTVTESELASDGSFAVGVRFPHFLSYAQLQQLK